MPRKPFWSKRLEEAEERRRLARFYKLRFYRGLLCDKHPSDQGVRYVSNNQCRTCRIVEEKQRRQREWLAAEMHLARLAGDPDLTR